MSTIYMTSQTSLTSLGNKLVITGALVQHAALDDIMPSGPAALGHYIAPVQYMACCTLAGQ